MWRHLQKFGQIFKSIFFKIMLMQPLPTVKKAYALLCEEEKHQGLTEAKGIDIVHAMNVKIHDNSKESQSDAQRQTRQGSSSYSKSQKSQGSKKFFFCTYCEGTTHTVDRCYYLNGFPVSHKSHGKDVQPPNRSQKPIAHQTSGDTHMDTIKTSTDQSLQFTPEELAQIKAFFKNGKNPTRANYTGPSFEEDDWFGEAA
ncbi:uncharacterized protein LOC125370076 isoform X2 [Ricinus communis]|uniref:uncharacterized protein LOC125370076 isoform X2 n=1 Tax=Ricinus communis TaxID=3988 RepID=UPI00201B12C9|nr:uncharacterized protein LOC125370076 isoform X2 [Ricinus communis]